MLYLPLQLRDRQGAQAMAGGSSSSLSRELLKRMREIRGKQRLDQVVLSACMGLPAQAMTAH